jgi:hypothetical protein
MDGIEILMIIPSSIHDALLGKEVFLHLLKLKAKLKLLHKLKKSCDFSSLGVWWFWLGSLGRLKAGEIYYTTLLVLSGTEALDGIGNEINGMQWYNVKERNDDDEDGRWWWWCCVGLSLLFQLPLSSSSYKCILCWSRKEFLRISSYIVYVDDDDDIDA